MSDVVAFRAAKSAMCIAPVRKGKGHLTVVSQFKQNKMYITTLQQYQTKAQDATPFMVISLHNDLLQVFCFLYQTKAQDATPFMVISLKMI
jgi:hypothetical protein